MEASDLDHPREQEQGGIRPKSINDVDPITGRSKRKARRTGERCIRSRTGIRFRHGSSARYDTKGFSTNQTWLKPKRALELKYIDETAELTAIYDQDAEFEHAEDLEGEDEVEPGPASSLGDGEGGDDAVDLPDTATHSYHQDKGTTDFTNSGTGTGDASNAGVSAWPSQTGKQSILENAAESTTGPSPLYIRSHWGAQSSIPYSSPVQTRPEDFEPPSSPLFTGLVKKPSRSSTQSIHTVQEVILLRYFVDHLARWFDLCDPEKHFEFIVPHRARWCPPLRNAMLAAAARHLTRVRHSKLGPENVYYLDGQPVPDLTEETALHYHSECIKDLLKRSLDPEQTRDENLLAAAIILRFYEEIDSPLRADEERDSELFLRVMNVFIDAQIPSVPLVPHSSPVINGPKVGPIARYNTVPSPEAVHSPIVPAVASPSQNLGSSVDGQSRWRADGLCQASFWVAFRQEIYSAFLKQRPFNHDLSRCEAFRSFSPAEDAVWADRLIIFCADVLEFCYGNSNSSTRLDTNLSTTDNWLSLKQYEEMWPEVLPASFEPIYYRDPDRSKGEVFPEVCYLADCHVTGVQHVELAKILLAVYDPTRPKLGPGHVASMKALSRELRTIVLRLCGIAMSNRKTPPGLVTALLGIVVCGDHFEDRMEQDALFGILDELEGTHAWPIGNTRNLLRDAWGRP
ncbi:uncharacterized protein Z519_04869 [Cladophialophora bantiana CBS 173.52]|uniref:ARCA protein n=1 Tax=Cladophialophora bantiana (strain ATCC 10958 / CBS 173.52 / CDC B-1940 / NIH 8579) TaxID=1442370 RepID=A0A0D2EY43_CLAB1|nr:uncharacterized protein Z519_04869 [Cladophialophora bantiana CBS 173.52]KIW94891.1 hypothetical protein Z519_04869 [Cladophialophora bantiana CBS 173.52]